MKYYELNQIVPRIVRPVGLMSAKCVCAHDFLDWVAWKLSIAYEDISEFQRKRIQKTLKTSASHSVRFRLKNRGMFEITEQEYDK